MSDIEGFDSPKHQIRVESDKHYITKCKKNIGIDLLCQTKHSLQPDIAMGWKPKIPTVCPLPLTYYNLYNQQLMNHIPNDDRFKIIYVGKRWSNSVQVNQQNSYSWKYRQRFHINNSYEMKRNEDSSFIKISEEVAKCKDNKNLSFDSCFQSGNLELAVRIKPNQYDLFIRSDTNTKGHTNWYYFKVANHDFVGSVQLNVCNLGKTKNLYNKGMKPYVLEQQQEKWSQQKSYDVCYVQRLSRYGFDRKTHQLQFKYNFKHKNTQVYFAYGIPYTYSKLEAFIKSISLSHKQLIKSEKLCESLGGLNLPLLTISDQSFIQSSQCCQNVHHNFQQKPIIQQSIKLKKKAILITSRIHPGQTNASYLLEGFVKELLKDTDHARKMREMYVFYIVPMLNPDGVVVGNFRTSYSGKDLNRQFRNINKHMTPQIHYLTELTFKLKQKYKRRLEFYFDFHGHSSKKSLFCYGPEHSISSPLYFKSRAFAKIMEQIHPIFSYYKSIFHVSQSKRSTGRAYMLWNMKIPMTYTFQMSNGLYETKQNKSICLDQPLLIEAGKTVFAGLGRYVALQTRSGTSGHAKAKVDSGIRSKKTSVDNQSRQKSFRMARIVSGKLSSSQNSSKISSVRTSSHQIKLNEIIVEKQFQKYVKQIKNQHLHHIEEEQGGSDSQGSDEDLTNDELEQLQQFVINRHKQSKTFSKKMFNIKMKPIRQQIPKKVMIMQDSVQNKENKRTQNMRIKVHKRIDSGKKQNDLNQHSFALKRPPLPFPKIYERVVLQQKNFTIQF